MARNTRYVVIEEVSTVRYEDSFTSKDKAFKYFMKAFAQYRRVPDAEVQLQAHTTNSVAVAYSVLAEKKAGECEVHIYPDFVLS